MNYDYFDNLQEQLKTEIAAYNELKTNALLLHEQLHQTIEIMKQKQININKLQQEIGEMK